MIDVYRQNPSLGDPATIEQNLSDNAKELDALNVDLHRYQVRDYCFAMLSTRHEFCSRHFEPDPPPQISVQRLLLCDDMSSAVETSKPDPS